MTRLAGYVQIALGALGVALIAVLTFDPTADAQRVPRAENGRVDLLAYPPQSLDQPRLVNPGEAAWLETVRPQYAVRLLGDAAARIRPEHGAVVPAGSLLFGMRVTGGYTYCPRIDFNAPVTRVQCFRDFNDDGVFDGGYLTRHSSINTQFLANIVHALDRVVPVPYEPVEPSDALETTSTIVFERLRNGQAVFRKYIDAERLTSSYACEPLAENPELCTLFGVTLRVEPVGDAVRITLVDSPDVRQLNMIMTNTALPTRN
ncbi:hypothetical protein [Maricaulis sp.]|uniref:hypothetical protein n=1 Tax=Maricaulis sp. TaxID=1486257 RepID=UPI003A940BC9